MISGKPIHKANIDDIRQTMQFTRQIYMISGKTIHKAFIIHKTQ